MESVFNLGSSRLGVVRGQPQRLAPFHPRVKTCQTPVSGGDLKQVLIETSADLYLGSFPNGVYAWLMADVSNVCLNRIQREKLSSLGKPVT